MGFQPRQVKEGIGATLALELPFAGGGHAGRGMSSIVAWLRGGVQRRGFAGDGQVQVDAVQQRAR